MKRHIPSAALGLGLALGCLASAFAAAPAVLENAPKGTVLFDDDGGRVQIVPRRSIVRTEPTFHGGPTISGGAIVPFFLGSGWRDAANRPREAQTVAALASRGGSATLPSLAPYRLAAPQLRGAALADPVGLPRDNRLSDLQIQRRLNRLVTAKGAPVLAADVVYVVFLPPGVRSTVGTSDSARDYAAYHNHLHSAAGIVHYVVVPYDDDFARGLASAQQALVEALINPEGDGWY